MDWKDIGARAAKTALQTFLAAIIPAVTLEVVGAPDVLYRVAIAGGIAALAAALSVVQNAMIAAWGNPTGE